MQVVQQQESLGGEDVALVAEEGDGAADVLREVLLAPALDGGVAAALGQVQLPPVRLGAEVEQAWRSQRIIEWCREISSPQGDPYNGICRLLC